MNTFTLSRLAGGVLLAAMAISIQAAYMSTTTDIVKGHAPVASGVTIANQTASGVQPRVGNVLQAGFSFNDPDGDAQSGSTYQWRRGSTNIGTNASTYTTVPADANQSLTVQVIPKTNTANTDPSSGTLAASPAIAVAAADATLGIGNFIAPDKAMRTWSGANSYCLGLGNGARLPTYRELQQLFVDATSSPTFFPQRGYIVNAEMCSKYGWPLYGQCGGGYDGYWSSTPTSAGSHYYVNLTGGNTTSTPDTGGLHVACVR